MLEATPDPISIKDLGGRYLLINGAGAALAGLRPEEVVGHLDTDIFPPEVAQRVQEEDRQVIRSAEKRNFEERVVLEGQPRTFLTARMPFRDRKGRVAGVIGIGRDITERQQADLRRAEFVRLGRSLHAVTSPQDAARTLLEVADRLLGWDACWLELWEPESASSNTVLLVDTVDGRRVETPTPYTDAHASERARQRAERGAQLELRDPEELRLGAYPFGNANRPSASLLYVPIRSDAGIIGVLSLQSYTPYAYIPADLETLQALADYCGGALRRTHAQALQQALEEQLRQTQKMEAIGRLAGGVAHDFNNMLAVINGYSELLRHMLPAGHPAQDGLSEIAQAGERAAGLTRQLLAFSRRQMLEAKELDLAPILTSLRGMLERLIGEDIELELCVSHPLWPVRADPVQIEQVILNLAVNSRDAMPKGGRLTLSAANARLASTAEGLSSEIAPGDYVELCVEDSGVGMAPEVASRIFEPFFTTKELGRGTGLGLSTVYGIIKQTGGQITVASRPGEGTRFRILLPRFPREASDG